MEAKSNGFLKNIFFLICAPQAGDEPPQTKNSSRATVVNTEPIAFKPYQ